jgi:hypothetical protein
MPCELAQAVRLLRPGLGPAEEARVELLALVWGPHFDRAHALLLAGRLGASGAAALHAAAERFDYLEPRRQQRLRRLALRVR